MSTDRTTYWREYARKNPDKIRDKKAAYRKRNKDKVAAYARTYRAEHPSKSTPHIQKPKTEALTSLKERFTAFRASRQSP